MARDHHLAGQILEQVQERDMADLLVVEAIAPCRNRGSRADRGDRCRPDSGPRNGNEAKTGMGTAMHQLDRVVSGKGLKRLRIKVDADRAHARLACRFISASAPRWLSMSNAVQRHQSNQRQAQTAASQSTRNIVNAPLPSHESATHRLPILWSQETINDAACRIPGYGDHLHHPLVVSSGVPECI